MTHKTAIRYRKRAVQLLGTACSGKGADPGMAASHGYHREIFQKILEQPDCQGIRFYPGINDAGQFTLLFAGFDSKGNNILKGTIGDTPFRCPPFCPTGDGVLS
ncbi:MAG: hypothetical protein FJ206_10460 [Gemmatimonadetes bacterium]|nr:hypothetical protein [Gemmatimonadota bacterium]